MSCCSAGCICSHHRPAVRPSRDPSASSVPLDQNQDVVHVPGFGEWLRRTAGLSQRTCGARCACGGGEVDRRDGARNSERRRVAGACWFASRCGAGWRRPCDRKRAASTSREEGRRGRHVRWCTSASATRTRISPIKAGVPWMSMMRRETTTPAVSAATTTHDRKKTLVSKAMGFVAIRDQIRPAVRNRL